MSLDEAKQRQHEMVSFIDNIMLPDAQLACSGNKAASSRLKKRKSNPYHTSIHSMLTLLIKDFSQLRRLIRESKNQSGKTISM